VAKLYNYLNINNKSDTTGRQGVQRVMRQT